MFVVKILPVLLKGNTPKIKLITAANKNKLNWGISGKSLNKAYMTDLINKLIEKNVKCNAILFNNGWYEFDNKKDFKKFNNYKFLN